MNRAVSCRLAVPWLKRLVAGWSCHGSSDQSPVGRAMVQAVSCRLAVLWVKQQSPVGNAMDRTVSFLLAVPWLRRLVTGI